MSKLLLFLILFLSAGDSLFSQFSQKDSLLLRKDSLPVPDDSFPLPYDSVPKLAKNRVKVFTDHGKYKGVLVKITDSSLVIDNIKNEAWDNKELMAQEINRLTIRGKYTFPKMVGIGAGVGVTLGIIAGVSEKADFCYDDEGNINFSCSLSFTAIGFITGVIGGAIASPFVIGRFSIKKDKLLFDLHRPKLVYYNLLK